MKSIVSLLEGWMKARRIHKWDFLKTEYLKAFMKEPGDKNNDSNLVLDESERGEWKSGLKTQHSENEDHGIWPHHFMGNRWGNSGNSVRLYFGGAPKSLQMVTAAMKLKDTYSLEGKLWPT